MLQFVPIHIDMHVCTFIEHIESGLIHAFSEVRRRLKESTDFTVHVRITSHITIQIRIVKVCRKTAPRHTFYTL